MYSTMQKYNLNEYITLWLKDILPKDYIQTWDYNTSSIQLEQDKIYSDNKIGTTRELPSAVINLDVPSPTSNSEVVQSHSNTLYEQRMMSETLLEIDIEERRTIDVSVKYIQKNTHVNITIKSKNIGESYTIKDLIEHSYVKNFKTVPAISEYVVPIEVGSIIITNNEKLYERILEYLSFSEMEQIQIKPNPLDDNNKILTSGFTVNPLVSIGNISINHNKKDLYSTTTIELEIDYQEVMNLMYSENNIIKDIKIIISE